MARPGEKRNKVASILSQTTRLLCDLPDFYQECSRECKLKTALGLLRTKGGCSLVKVNSISKIIFDHRLLDDQRCGSSTHELSSVRDRRDYVHQR